MDDSSKTSEKAAEGLAGLRAALARLCPAGDGTAGESPVLGKCSTLDRAELGKGWAELLYHVQDKRFGQMMFPRCVFDSVCNNHLWSAPLDGFLGK